MCQTGRGRSGFAGHDTGCGCSCTCPATTTIEEELPLLEDHRKYMQDHLGEIDKKIAALKASRES